MAKSTRSKVKRHFRAKKRTEGVYAANEAARLARLHSKLKVITTQDRDGDVPVEDEAGMEAEGWSWFTGFGLVDPLDIYPESFAPGGVLVGGSSMGRRADEGTLAHLFLGLNSEA